MDTLDPCVQPADVRRKICEEFVVHLAVVGGLILTPRVPRGLGPGEEVDVDRGPVDIAPQLGTGARSVRPQIASRCEDGPARRVEPVVDSQASSPDWARDL